tara:strand:- start:405 stop:950 length:546 start_codon:yes stop_codon:yes gene_type:complete
MLPKAFHALTYVIVCLAAERALREHVPRRGLTAITHWSIACVAWVFLVRQVVPESLLLRGTVPWLGVAWPLAIAVAESFAIASGESPRENRGSVQMDMGALLNIGFSLSTVAAMARERGFGESARCVALLTSSVVIICLCFLIPNPLVFRAGIFQKIAISFATGMLLVSSGVSIQLKMCGD